MLSESSGHQWTLLDRREVASNGNVPTSWVPILALPLVLCRFWNLWPHFGQIDCRSVYPVSLTWLFTTEFCVRCTGNLLRRLAFALSWGPTLCCLLFVNPRSTPWNSCSDALACSSLHFSMKPL